MAPALARALRENSADAPADPRLQIKKRMMRALRGPLRVEVTMIVEPSQALAGGLLLLWGMVLAIAVPAAAQNPTFDIEGVVTDAQQGVLPGATITLLNVATGLSRETATDANGRYVFTALP